MNNHFIFGESLQSVTLESSMGATTVCLRGFEGGVCFLDVGVLMAAHSAVFELLLSSVDSKEFGDFTATALIPVES